MSFFDFIKTFDTFGSQVGLHFGNWFNNEKGIPKTFKTATGGFISFCIAACFWAVLGLYGY